MAENLDQCDEAKQPPAQSGTDRAMGSTPPLVLTATEDAPWCKYLRYTSRPQKYRNNSGKDAKCTVDELMNIITGPSGGFTMLPSDALNEVYPNLFIGDMGSATNIFVLKKLKISHVLNAAKGSTSYHVKTSRDTYKGTNIQFLGIEATDISSCSLEKHFAKASAFIEKALNSGGRVLVNCREGVSRSATLVLAFLMLTQQLTAQEAVRLVRKHREIAPNFGFLQQLCDLNEVLHQEGHLFSEG